MQVQISLDLIFEVIFRNSNSFRRTQIWATSHDYESQSRNRKDISRRRYRRLLGKDERRENLGIWEYLKRFKLVGTFDAQTADGCRAAILNVTWKPEPPLTRIFHICIKTSQGIRGKSSCNILLRQTPVSQAAGLYWVFKYPLPVLI